MCVDRVSVLDLGTTDVLWVRETPRAGSTGAARESIGNTLDGGGFDAEGVEVDHGAPFGDREAWQLAVAPDADNQPRVAPRDRATIDGRSVRPREAKRLGVSAATRRLKIAAQEIGGETGRSLSPPKSAQGRPVAPWRDEKIEGETWETFAERKWPHASLNPQHFAQTAYRGRKRRLAAQRDGVV